MFLYSISNCIMLYDLPLPGIKYCVYQIPTSRNRKNCTCTVWVSTIYITYKLYNVSNIIFAILIENFKFYLPFNTFLIFYFKLF